jgi:iron complex transport system permease protein
MLILKTRIRTAYMIAAIAAFMMIPLAFAVGQFPISIADIVSLIWSKLSGTTSHAAPNADIVLFEIRGPRIAAAFMVGAALAAAGATFQNLFRNPLVSPDILGVSSGAALGAVAGIFLSLPLIAIQGFAFVGGLLAVAIIFWVGNKIRGHDPVLTLVLTGVVIGSLLGSGVALLKYLADPFNQLPAITYWLLGSFASVTQHDIFVAFVIIFVAIVPLFLLRWRINILALPDDEAKALGLDVVRMRIVVITAATLMTAASVAICGIIGWVGLVIPHAVRLMVGAEFSRLLPLSMLVGGTFMLAVDTLGRSVAQTEIPPGVLTALIGAPAFIWLMAATFKRREK